MHTGTKGREARDVRSAAAPRRVEPRPVQAYRIEAGEAEKAHAAEHDVAVHQQGRAPAVLVAEDARVAQPHAFVHAEWDPVRVRPRAEPLLEDVGERSGADDQESPAEPA